MPNTAAAQHLLRQPLLRLAVLLTLLFPGSAQAGGFSAMVADVETGIILTGDQIDASRSPVLLARLATITMGIQDITDETLDPEEMIGVRPGRAIPAMAALQATALGEEGYRAPITALASRIGHNARLFDERIEAIQTRVGMRASSVDVVRAPDGGPGFEGHTTVRDTVRLAISVLDGHPGLVDRVFSPATGNIPTTRLWMEAEGACLLGVEGRRSGRTLAAALTGAPSAAECFRLAVDLLAEQDLRIVETR